MTRHVLREQRRSVRVLLVGTNAVNHKVATRLLSSVRGSRCRWPGRPRRAGTLPGKAAGTSCSWTCRCPSWTASTATQGIRAFEAEHAFTAPPIVAVTAHARRRPRGGSQKANGRVTCQADPGRTSSCARSRVRGRGRQRRHRTRRRHSSGKCSTGTKTLEAHGRRLKVGSGNCCGCSSGTRIHMMQQLEEALPPALVRRNASRRARTDSRAPARRSRRAWWPTDGARSKASRARREDGRKRSTACGTCEDRDAAVAARARALPESGRRREGARGGGRHGRAPGSRRRCNAAGSARSRGRRARGVGILKRADGPAPARARLGDGRARRSRILARMARCPAARPRTS